MNDFSQSGDETRQATDLPQREEFKDGLIFPAYRQFCRDEGLNLQGGDVELHAEAMALFNRFKPHYSYFRGQVVHFHVWPWDLSQTTQSVEEFLAKAAQDQARLHKLEKWFEIMAASLIYLSALVCVMVFDRWLPYWLVLIVFSLTIWAVWQWFFVTRPRQKRERNHAALENQLVQLRQKLTDIQVSKQIRTSGLAGVAGPKLGEALAEHVLAREADDPGDREHRRYILADINDLLMSAAQPGSEIDASMLDVPSRLQSHLEASMELPAQTLAKALPNRLTEWLKAEPPPKHLERPQWVESGRFLLDQARL